jgi:transcriptional regulator with XRE-family HTH domain
VFNDMHGTGNMKVKTQARLRLATVDGELVSSGYKSGRKEWRDTPDTASNASTLSAGIPLRRHLSTACGEIPSRLAKAPSPPARLITRSNGFSDMHISQPQVDFAVNLPLLVRLNPGLHAYGMSPLGKTIKTRLKAMGHTQSWLAETVGVSENAVSKWIKTGEISRDNIKPTADALQISVAHLLDENPTPELDERWHSFPPSVKQRVLALIDELVNPPQTPPVEQKKKRRAG